MISVKELCLFKYGSYNRGKAGRIGRELSEAGISTFRKDGLTWADVPDGTSTEKLIGPGTQNYIRPPLPPDPKPPVTIDSLLKTVENMALVLAEKDSQIASLKLQLAQVNGRVSDVVRRAVAVYGD